MIAGSGSTPESPRDVYLVTTSDGHRFHCAQRWVGGDEQHPRQCRWSIVSAGRVAYNGPPYQAALSPDEIGELFEDWWAGKQAMGQDYG